MDSRLRFTSLAGVLDLVAGATRVRRSLARTTPWRLRQKDAGTAKNEGGAAQRRPVALPAPDGAGFVAAVREALGRAVEAAWKSKAALGLARAARVKVPVATDVTTLPAHPVSSLSAPEPAAARPRDPVPGSTKHAVGASAPGSARGSAGHELGRLLRFVSQVRRTVTDGAFARRSAPAIGFAPGSALPQLWMHPHGLTFASLAGFRARVAAPLNLPSSELRGRVRHEFEIAARPRLLDRVARAYGIRRGSEAAGVAEADRSRARLDLVRPIAAAGRNLRELLRALDGSTAGPMKGRPLAATGATLKALGAGVGRLDTGTDVVGGRKPEVAAGVAGNALTRARALLDHVGRARGASRRAAEPGRVATAAAKLSAFGDDRAAMAKSLGAIAAAATMIGRAPSAAPSERKAGSRAGEAAIQIHHAPTIVINGAGADPATLREMVRDELERSGHLLHRTLRRETARLGRTEF